MTRRNHSTTGIVILAAGASTRLGTPKQLLNFGGRSLLRRAVESALDSVCRPVVVVLGAEADRLAGEVSGLPVQTVVNGRWNSGIGSSIRAGIETLEGGVDAAVILLCDQPLVTGPVIDAIVAAYSASGRSIVVSEYAGTVGVPALFSRAHFTELMTLADDAGAKALINKHLADAHRIPFENGALDIDTPKDVAHLRAIAESSGDIAELGTPSGLAS